MKKNKSILSLFFLIISSCAPPPPLVLTPSATVRDIPPAGQTQAVSGVPTIEPTLEALQLAVYPTGSRTGNAELDPIIEALLRHNFPSLKELTSYTQIGCTFADGLGGPPKCQEEELEGTILEVVPFLGPEGHHLRRADYEDWEGPDVLGLLAAYRTSPATYSDPAYPAGDYALLFLLAGGPETVTLQITDGRILRYDYHYGGQTSGDIEQQAAYILLPLNFNPVPTPVPWNSFTDPDSRFSFIYPPSLELLPADKENKWHLGNRIRVEVLPFERSWIGCFYQSLGDCPFVELDEYVKINGQEVRRIEGYIGSVGGNIPQEFLCYIFDLGGQALAMTVYALPFGTQLSEVSPVWPLEGMELELFERTIQTVILN